MKNTTKLKKELIGKTVHDMLEIYNIDTTKLMVIDEPPGKLIGFLIPIENKSDIIVYINTSNKQIFSQMRNWKVSEYLFCEIIDAQYSD